MLYKKVAEAERNPFFLHPHQVTSIFPFLPFPSTPSVATSSPSSTTSLNAGKFSPIYPLVQPSPPKTGLTMPNTSLAGPTMLTPPSSVSASSTITTQASLSSTNLVLSSGMSNSTGTVVTSMAAPSTPPRPPYTTQFYAPFMKYPMSPPTPSGISTLSVLSPWNIAAVSQLGVPIDPNATNAKTVSGVKVDGAAAQISSSPSQGLGCSSGIAWSPAAMGNAASAPILPQHVMSPRPSFASLQSPLSFLHASPLSPMMLIHSPYASSVSSCPSVSSSSGCSSDGGASVSGLSKKHYAPSEYHVGPRRPLCEKLTEEEIVNEGANSSGRNTPVDNLEEEEEEEDSVAQNQNASVLVGGLTGIPTFTPFSITSHGPSITQPAAPQTRIVGGAGGGHVPLEMRGSGAPGTRMTNSIDLTGQAVSYPYSVESMSHSAPSQPMSVDSSTHVS